MKKRKEITLSESQIVNLTSTPISAYTNNGSIITIPPTAPEDFNLVGNKFYIVEKVPPNLYLNWLKSSIPSQGRGGVLVSVLTLYNQPDIRVFPTEG